MPTTRTIICPDCGGSGTTDGDTCEACEGAGVVEHDGPARPDGLPWHSWAVEGPSDLHEPPQRPRGRAPGSRAPARSMTAAELEAASRELDSRARELDERERALRGVDPD